MNIVKKAMSLFKKSGAKAGIIDSLGAMDIFEFDAVETYLKAASGKAWASYRSCRLVADVFLTTEWSLQPENSFTNKRHPKISPILERPNEYETFQDMLMKWVFHMKLTGTVFWLKDRATPDGTCTGLYALNPKRMKIYTDRFRGILGYGYWVNGIEIPFETYEIIYWKRPHPDEDVKGLGEVEAGVDLLNNFVAQQKFQTNFLKSGSTYSNILVHKEQIDDEQAFAALKAKWQKEYGGSDKSGKTAWLSGDWSNIQTGMSIKDMMALETMQYSVNQVFSLHGIPPSMRGIESAGNTSASKTEDTQFRKYTVLPDMTIFADGFTRSFIRPFSRDLWFVFNLGGIANVKDIVDDYKPLMDAGAMTPNELREAVGLGRVDDPALDEFLVGTNLVPLRMLASGLNDDNPDDNPDDLPVNTGSGEDNRGRGRDDLGNRDRQLENQGKAIIARLKKNSQTVARVGHPNSGHFSTGVTLTVGKPSSSARRAKDSN